MIEKLCVVVINVYQVRKSIDFLESTISDKYIYFTMTPRTCIPLELMDAGTLVSSSSTIAAYCSRKTANKYDNSSVRYWFLFMKWVSYYHLWLAQRCWVWITVAVLSRRTLNKNCSCAKSKALRIISQYGTGPAAPIWEENCTSNLWYVCSQGSRPVCSSAN